MENISSILFVRKDCSSSFSLYIKRSLVAKKNFRWKKSLVAKEKKKNALVRLRLQQIVYGKDYYFFSNSKTTKATEKPTETNEIATRRFYFIWRIRKGATNINYSSLQWQSRTGKQTMTRQKIYSEIFFCFFSSSSSSAQVDLLFHRKDLQGIPFSISIFLNLNFYSKNLNQLIACASFSQFFFVHIAFYKERTRQLNNRQSDPI